MKGMKKVKEGRKKEGKEDRRKTMGRKKVKK